MQSVQLVGQNLYKTLPVPPLPQREKTCGAKMAATEMHSNVPIGGQFVIRALQQSRTHC